MKNPTQAYAIVIGSGLLSRDKYGGCEVETKTCENDAQAMATFATERRFKLIGPGDEPEPFLSKDAYRDKIESAVRRAAKDLKRGGMLLLYYAGHGASLPIEHEPPYTKRQQAWCLTDGRFWELEWDHLIAEFNPGVRLVIVSDSCHSGGFGEPGEDDLQFDFNVRCTNPRVLGEECVKQLEGNAADEFDRVRMAVSAKYGNKKPKLRARVLLLAACQANQRACTDETHGLFTRRLLEVAAERAPARTYAEFFHRVRRKRFDTCQSPFWWVSGPDSHRFSGEQAFSSEPLPGFSPLTAVRRILGR